LAICGLLLLLILIMRLAACSVVSINRGSLSVRLLPYIPALRAEQGMSATVAVLGLAARALTLGPSASLRFEPLDELFDLLIHLVSLGPPQMMLIVRVRAVSFGFSMIG
jgi:hypothetical protein